MRKLVCLGLIVLLIAAGCVLVHISNIDKQNQEQYELIKAQYKLIRAQDELIDAFNEQYNRCIRGFFLISTWVLAPTQAEFKRIESELNALSIEIGIGKEKIDACSYNVQRARR